MVLIGGKSRTGSKLVLAEGFLFFFSWLVVVTLCSEGRHDAITINEIAAIHRLFPNFNLRVEDITLGFTRHVSPHSRGQKYPCKSHPMSFYSRLEPTETLQNRPLCAVIKFQSLPRELP